MSSATRYAFKVVGISLVFIPLNIAALIALQEKVTWWNLSLIIGALAVADIVFILAAKRAEKTPYAKHPSKSTNAPR